MGPYSPTTPITPSSLRATPRAFIPMTVSSKGRSTSSLPPPSPPRIPWTKRRRAGVELELIPISYDAMVFFTNGDNPAEGITMEQIRDIYVENAYDNWRRSEAGCRTDPLLPQPDSGSQAQMEEFFLHGSQIHPDIQRETTSVAMASVLTDVYDAGQKDPLTYGLGYSVYYYYLQTAPMLVGPTPSSCLRWTACIRRTRPSPTAAIPWRGTTTRWSGRRDARFPGPPGWRSSCSARQGRTACPTPDSDR